MAKVDNELRVFVRESLGKGVARKDIQKVLEDATWSADQIEDALAAFANVDFPVPVPRPQPSLSAREAFLYLMLFTALYVSAINLGDLLFVFIDHFFPDPALEPSDALSFDRIRFGISALIVAFPVFLWVNRLISRALVETPVLRVSPIRKWLTYLTLFIAATVVIGDITTLIYNLLGGELTIRFVLKVLVVGGMAGSIFWYYLQDLRKDEA